VRGIIKTLAEQLPDTYFQEAGAKMIATKTAGTPDDNITRVLKAAGIKAHNIPKVRPHVEGLTVDTLRRQLQQCQGYDSERFEDCSYLLVHRIKERGIKPVAPVEAARVTTDIEDNAFWEVRIKLWHPYYLDQLAHLYTRQQVMKALEKVPAYYWQDMPGPSAGEKIDQAEAKMMSFDEFRKLVEGQ
jgi:hypothetical protein